MWRRAGDAGGGWCQLPSPPGQQSHWSEHSDELCQRPRCQIFQCTIVFQCTNHTVLMLIEQSTLLFLCWRWWSTEAASCCTFPRRLKRATQSDRGALLSFPLLICSQVDVLARIWHKSSLPILAFTVPFCQHQVAVTFSLKPAQHPLSSSVATDSL